MKQTRRGLIAANTQLNAQLAACHPESRHNLRANLAAARKEVERLTKENEALSNKLHALDLAAQVPA